MRKQDIEALRRLTKVYRRWTEQFEQQELASQQLRKIEAEIVLEDEHRRANGEKRTRLEALTMPESLILRLAAIQPRQMTEPAGRKGESAPKMNQDIKSFAGESTREGDHFATRQRPHWQKYPRYFADGDDNNVRSVIEHPRDGIPRRFQHKSSLTIEIETDREWFTAMQNSHKVYVDTHSIPRVYASLCGKPRATRRIVAGYAQECYWR